MATNSLKPLVVIVGPTASGKTALAIEIAKKYDGEIICADSRTVYKDMNIGTAKPTVPEMQGVPHHLLDIVEPDQKFTVSDFKHLADKSIADIQSRGKLPILVGGSGLYINSVIYDYDFSASSGPRDEQNPRHLSPEAPTQVQQVRPDTLILGINMDPDLLKERIAKRVDLTIENGLVDELKMLANKYGWELSPMHAPAYKAFRPYLEGTIDLDQAKAQNIVYDSRLAKKQRTWFKRNNSIHWLSDPSKYVDILTTFLNNR